MENRNHNGGVMYYRKPYYYSQFKCIADKCPATCCEGWAIVIDDKTMKKYHSLPETDKAYVLSHVDNSEGVFKRCGDRCAFLNDRNLCNLYTRLGEEAFCNTCRRYPRHFEEYGNLLEAALSMSCPVAAKMIVTNPKQDRFVAYRNNKKSPHGDEVDAVLLAGLLEAREHMIGIVNDRSISLQQRLKRVYQYSYKVQKLIYNYEALGKKVKKSKRVSEFLLKMDLLTKKEANYELKVADTINQNRQRSMLVLLDIMSVLENINSDWPRMMEELKNTLYFDMTNEEYMAVSKEFEAYMQDRNYEYAHIVNYFLYTYYLGGVYDYNVHSMTKLALISCAIIRDFGLLAYIKNKKTFTEEEQIRICYTYSRQIEHSDDNLMALEGLLAAHPELSDENIIRML